MEKTFNSRIQLKSDTTANWDKATNFIPKEGEMCVYLDRIETTDDSGEKILIPGIKVGDGKTTVGDLEFASEDNISNEDIDEILGSTSSGGNDVEEPKIVTITFPRLNDNILSDMGITPNNSYLYFTNSFPNELGSISNRITLYEILTYTAPLFPSCPSHTIQVVAGTLIFDRWNHIVSNFIPKMGTLYRQDGQDVASVGSNGVFYVLDNVVLEYDGPM